MNNIQIRGNVGKVNPDRYTAQGVLIKSFSMADSYGKDDRKRTSWWSVIVFGEQGASLNVNKGDYLQVTGRAEIRIYDKKDGTKGFSADVYANEVVAAPTRAGSEIEL